MSTAPSAEKERAGTQDGPRRRSKRKGGAPKRAAEFLDRLLPDTDEQSGTAYADRKTRLKTAHKMDYTFDRAVKTFDRIEEELDKNEETVEQREWNDRDRRRRSDEEARCAGEVRKDIRLVVEVEERRRALRHKDVLLGLTAVTTLAAVALAYLAVSHNRIEYAGVSAFSTLLSGVEVYVMRLITWPQEGRGTSVDAGPPFRWSVLEFFSEVEEAEGPG